jgi:NhaP-type Na+/H+ or K+/H+ antiporter
MTGHANEGAFWLRFAMLQVVLGPLAGAAVGYFGGRLVSWGRRAGWMSDAFGDLAALGLALLAYAGAEVVGGNGFIAAFTAGLTLGNTARSLCSSVYEFAEAEGQLLTLLSFVVFGAVLVGPALDGLGPATLLYALASLTLVRMVPVWLSLTGLGLEPSTRAFIGWFGPRGIASILYGLLLLEGSGLEQGGTVFSVTMLTILLSVVLHGVTAWPGVRWYGTWADNMKDEPDMPEMQPVSEMPVRLPYDESLEF